ncbi:MAG: hypothetical protein HRT44_13085 [Bdellovibrionales bacterium]|nr:hypothetical protein [Bdellovibrionales bacterium]NQZ20172.1 hypothetical protein [Bdellovibrionales bacterium]
MGGGLIYSQEGGDDLANSTELPNAKWLSAYVGFAFDFSGAATDSLGFGGSQFGRNGFQLEVFYQRDPEVVEINGVSNIVYPETTTIGAFGQYSQNLGLSDFLLAFEITSKSRSSVELFQPEGFSSLRIGTLAGYKIDSWFFSAHTFNETYDGATERSEISALLSIAYLYSGFNGDSNFSF